MGNFPCMGCACCSHMLRGDTFTHPHTGQVFKIRQRYTCTSRFVIYMITCPCGLVYVGETTMEIRMRISKHKSTIRTGLNELTLPKHFEEQAHTIGQLRFRVIDSVPPLRRGSDRCVKWMEKELMWIHRLGCLMPDQLGRWWYMASSIVFNILDAILMLFTPFCLFVFLQIQNSRSWEAGVVYKSATVLGDMDHFCLVCSIMCMLWWFIDSPCWTIYWYIRHHSSPNTCVNGNGIPVHDLPGMGDILHGVLHKVTYTFPGWELVIRLPPWMSVYYNIRWGDAVGQCWLT